MLFRDACKSILREKESKYGVFFGPYLPVFRYFSRSARVCEFIEFNATNICSSKHDIWLLTFISFC